MTRSGSPDRTLINDLALAAVSGVALVVVLAATFRRPAGADPPVARGRPAVGEVTRQLNSVRRRVEGDLVWNPIVRGAPVFAEDAVYVGPDSEAAIELEDGSRIEIDESSLVVISRQGSAEDVADNAVAVRILHGGATGETGRGSLALHAGKSTTRLANQSAARVRVRGDRTASVAVRSGTAQVEREAGEALTVREGERRWLDDAGHSLGKTEKATIELVSPAAGARLFVTPKRRRVSFAWRPEAGSGKYALEVANDPDFESTALRVSTHVPRAEVRLPAEGVFYWRVLGSERGEDRVSEERRLVVVEEAAPVPYRPVEDSVVDLSDGRPLTFAWGTVPGVERYILEVAQADSFNTPLYSVSVSRPFYIVRPSESHVREGRHCFRVRSSAADRDAPPWSKPVCFRIVTRPVLRAPKLYPTSTDREAEKPVDDGSGGPRGSLILRLLLPSAHAAPPPGRLVRMRWERLTGAAAYEIEIATDREFVHIVLQERVSTNTFSWQPPTIRPYYWRVRGIDRDGRKGKVSERRMIEMDLPGPTASKPATGSRVQYAAARPRVLLEWLAVADAVGYTVEVARDAEFVGAVDTLRTEATSVEYSAPALGAFFWRAIALYEGGNTTLPGPSSSFVVVSAPPQPLAPKNGTRVPMTGPETEVVLSWTRRPVRRFEVAVGTDRKLTKVVNRAVASEPTAVIAVGEPGELFWQVRAVEPETRWSRAGSFVVLPATPVPSSPGDGAALARDTALSTVQLCWAAATGARSYHVTLQPLASGGAAHSSMESFSSSGTATTVEVRAPGTYTWSVSAVYDESLVSDASAPRSFSVQLAPIEAAGGGDLEPTVHIAPHVGLAYNFGEVFAGRFGVEAGARALVAGHRLGVSVTAAYFTHSTAFSESGIDVESRLHALPVELAFVYVLPSDGIDLTGGVGLAVVTTYARVSVAGQADMSSTDVAVGGLATVGLERQFGSGDFFAEVLFGFGSRATGIVETESGRMSVDVGYRISVW